MLFRSNLSDHENKYIVAFDQAFDNIQVVREHQLLQTCIRERRNVYELRLICFEDVLLEFEYLLDWIYAPHDEFIQKRAVAITAREKLIAAIRNQGIDYKQIKELQEYHQYLIIGRDVRDFLAAEDNLYELQTVTQNERTEFSLKRYLEP